MSSPRSEGMTYAPKGKPSPVVKDGEFIFSAVALDHGHIYGMCNGLIEAGAKLKYVYDPDPKKVEAFVKQHPNVTVAASEQQVLDDKDTQLVASAAVTNLRCALGLRVMKSGKDYFTDKAPFTTLSQVEEARKVAGETGKKYMCYYSERLHVEGAIYAGQLVEQGAIGKVIHVEGMGPHRLSAGGRPPWFFVKEQYGGILCDIGSHQIEQFLFYSGAKDATITQARVCNFNHPEYPELDDFGMATLTGDNGVSNYFRVDWFNPDGHRTWGDGRLFILGTEGYIEVRKYIDVATEGEPSGNNVIWVNGTSEYRFNASGKVGCPFFGQFILDCINRTENAMTQAHAFKAGELCVRAQMMADYARK